MVGEYRPSLFSTEADLICFLSFHPSIHPSIHPFIHPSIHLSIYLSIYLSIHPSIHLRCILQVIKGSEDNPAQYMNFMNTVFTAQKLVSNPSSIYRNYQLYLYCLFFFFFFVCFTLITWVQVDRFMAKLIIIARGFIPLSPLTIVAMMVKWENSQNICRAQVKRKSRKACINALGKAI